MIKNKNFFDDIDTNWDKVVGDIYSKTVYIELLDTNYLNVSYNNYKNDKHEDYKINIEDNKNTLEIFLYLTIDSNSDNIKITNKQPEVINREINRNYENVYTEDIVSNLYINVWKNYSGYYNYNFKYKPYSLIGYYKNQVRTELFSYLETYDKIKIGNKDYCMNPFLLYKQIDKFIELDLNNYIKNEYKNNVLNILEKIKLDIEILFNNMNEKYKQ